MRSSFRTTWTVAVLASASAFVFQLGVRAEVLRLGYALAEASAERTALVETRDQLRLRAQLLRRPATANFSHGVQTTSSAITADAGRRP
jgi:hypothetical protein